MLQEPKPLPDLEPKELDNVIGHLEKEGKAGNLPIILRCKVALRFEEIRAALDQCRAAMAKAPFNDPRSSQSSGDSPFGRTTGRVRWPSSRRLGRPVWNRPKFSG